MKSQHLLGAGSSAEALIDPHPRNVVVERLGAMEMAA